MTEITHMTRKERTAGDAAVDGLCSGVLAGIGMAVYLLAAGLLGGEAPALLLGRFDPGQAASPMNGLLAHLAVSGVYGLLFGLAWRLGSRWRQPPAWLAGLAYGVALLLVAESFTLRISGMSSPLLGIPLVHIAISHLIYGLVLGVLVNRQRAVEI
jgi:hypothetical protein